MNKKKTLIICIILLLVAAAVTLVVFLTEPTASREGATKETAMLVEVTEVNKGAYEPTIVATGTVQPSRDIMLSSRVSGEVVYMAENYAPGGFVKEGEVLLRIDPSDFRNTLQLRKSELSQAMANLEIEQGRQDVARQDYELVDEMVSTDEENLELVLREPQLNSAQAQVEAARAAVNQAQLNLQRATIRAPFDAHILTRNVNLGSQVAVGDNLGRLVGREEYWIVVTVPLSRLPWISFPREDGIGSDVKIIDRKSWENGLYRMGKVFRLVGALEDQTRMARILVTIDDPFAIENDSLPTLIINSFVEAQIQAEKIPDVVRLNRDYLRQDETVWVMDSGKLDIREVDIALLDAKYAYITKGLQDDEKVVTTNLSTVSAGARLRTNETDSAAQSSDTAQQMNGQTQSTGGAR